MYKLDLKSFFLFSLKNKAAKAKKFIYRLYLEEIVSINSLMVTVRVLPSLRRSLNHFGILIIAHKTRLRRHLSRWIDKIGPISYVETTMVEDKTQVTRRTRVGGPTRGKAEGNRKRFPRRGCNHLTRFYG